MRYHLLQLVRVSDKNCHLWSWQYNKTKVVWLGILKTFSIFFLLSILHWSWLVFEEVKIKQIFNWTTTADLFIWILFTHLNVSNQIFTFIYILILSFNDFFIIIFLQQLPASYQAFVNAEELVRAAPVI